MPQVVLMKTEYLILLSCLLTFVVITNAFYAKRQFYPSVVYLTKSSTSLAVLYVQAFVFAVLLGKLVQKIFLGQLRAIETEHLYDRAWFSITETCLAFTVFRDDFSPRFVALFAILLFLKCFHWLLEDRVDYMEQSPILGPIFHGRVISLLSVLIFLDYLFVSSAYSHTITRGASVQIVFGFEYAILMVTALSIAIKYFLHVIEIRHGEQWDNKGVFMLYSDLVLGFFRFVFYLIFIAVMMKIHTFPLFAIRPMFIAMKAFRKSCNDVIESRRAIRYLNTMYPDLTAEELANVADTTCIICREDMQVQQCIKRLGCAHVFHKNCLRSWFQRQQTCPICRTTVLRPAPTRAAPAPAQAPTVGAAQAQAQAPPAANAGAAQAGQPPIHGSGILPPPPPPPPGFTGTAPVPPPMFNFTPFNNINLQTGNNNNPTTTGVLPQFTMNTFPMVLPPFAFPPPPLPPLNFTGLSEEAIRAMEGSELENVQARIRCLRNVRTLLDASIIQMQQYMNIVLTQSNMDNNVRLLADVSADIDRLLESPAQERTVKNESPSEPIVKTEDDADEDTTDKNSAEFLRKQRLAHFLNHTQSSSTATNDDDSKDK